MTSAVGSFVFPQAGRIVLPLVAFLVLLITGDVDTEALLITGLSLVVAVAVGVVVWLIGRSEASARWVGRQLYHSQCVVERWCALSEGSRCSRHRPRVSLRGQWTLLRRSRWPRQPCNLTPTTCPARRA